MFDFYQHWRNKIFHYERLCDSSRESTPEKQAYLDSENHLSPGMSKFKGGLSLETAPLDFYEGILKPYLHTLATNFKRGSRN